MFKFLKEKLKGAVKKFSKDIEEEAEDVELKEEEKEEQVEEKEDTKEVEPEEKEEPEEKSEELPEEKEEPEESIEEKTEEPEPQEIEEKEEPDEEEPDFSKMTVAEAVDVPKEEQKEEPEPEEIEEKEEPSVKEVDDIVDELDSQEETVDEGKDKEGSDDTLMIEEPDERDIEVPEPEDKDEEADLPPAPEDKPKKKGFFGRLFGKKEEPEDKEEPEERSEELPEEEKEASVEETPVSEKEEDSKEKEKEEEKLEEELVSEEDKLIEKIDEKKQKVGEELKEDDEELKDFEPEDKKEPEEIKDLDEKDKKKGFFSKIKESVSGKKLSEAKFEDLFFELEVALLENNVAIEVIEKIKEDLKENLVDKKLNRFEIEKIIARTLQKSIDEILTFDKVDIIKKIKDKKKGDVPFSIVFVGINGSGKTTTIAKMAQYFIDNGLKVVLAAADTFRAAAIQQLEEHANNLNVKMIKHDYGSDPAAVAFDAIKYAKSKSADVVLIDTAGRLHSNANLMDEMRKIIRVASPDMKVFIGESITGNDCVEQASKFDETIGLDGIVLSKADVDEKGGAALSVSFVTKKPILFLGTGQEYKDIKPFDKKEIMTNLGF